MDKVYTASNRWADGTRLLAMLIERLAPGGSVVVTRAEVEAADLGCSHPVVFTLDEDDQSITMTVQRPASPATSETQKAD